MKPVYFKAWMSDWNWGVRIALFLILLSSLVQLGMFVLTQNYLVAYLGAQAEDISFAFICTYAGIVTILPVQFRFLRYFETKGYLICNMLLAILLNYFCLRCQDINLFFAIRFLQGILAGNINACVLVTIFSRLPSARAREVGSAVFYGTILGNTVLAGLVTGVVVGSADWTVTYRYLILFELFVLAISLLTLKRSTGQKSYPLYQIDWAGYVMFAFGTVALAYTMIYGSRYYWFEDPRICYSSLATGIAAVLFLYRQRIVKRPLLHLEALKSKNFVVGLCLLSIYYGSKDSIVLIYSYTGGPLKWSTLQVITLGVINVAGLISLLIFATSMMIHKKHRMKLLLTTGFALMGIFNLWMSFLLTPDLSLSDLALPVFLHGAASGLLFVPIMIWVVSSAPAHTGATGLVVAAFTRFTITLNSIAGFYNIQLYYNQYFKNGFLAYLSPENQNMTERLNSYRSFYASKGFFSDQASTLANAAIWQNLNEQSQLLTNREIYMLFGMLLMLIAMLVLIIPAITDTFSYRNRHVPVIKNV